MRGVTLERTRPGRWSRTCSSVAAMSISFTPECGGHGAAQGVSREGQDPESWGIPGQEAWRAGRSLGRELQAPRGRPSPFAMRFSTMSTRM